MNRRLLRSTSGRQSQSGAAGQQQGTASWLSSSLFIILGVIALWGLYGVYKFNKPSQTGVSGPVEAYHPDMHVQQVDTMAPKRYDVCHMENNNEYHGNVVKWGDTNKRNTAAECCEQCQLTKGCNIWVWCGRPEGCTGQPDDKSHKACWLKQAILQEVYEHSMGKGHPGIKWTAGAVFDEAREKELQSAVEAREEVDRQRREALRANEELPLVYLDVSIDGKPSGRIEAVLFTKEAPLAAENMRALCTGEKGIAPQGTEGAGKPLSLKGAYFYRIIDRFIDQTGQTGSIYGTNFVDEPGALALKHDRRGLLSLANGGPNTNSGHFSIVVAPAPHLNGHYGIFGEVVRGLEIMDAINALSRGSPNNELLNSKRAQIVDAGQIRQGSYKPQALDPRTGKPVGAKQAA